MLCDPILKNILNGLLHCIKHEKLALLFNYPEGNPLRPSLVKKTQATEKAANGMWAVLQGCSSELAQEGFQEMVAALDELAPKLKPESVLKLYEERAGILGLLEKMKHLDEILALPDDDTELSDVEPDTKSHLN